MTTKRAFTMLPKYSGTAEEYENWRFQMVQFLSQEPFFVEILEWIANECCSEEQQVLVPNCNGEALAMIKALAAGE